MNEEIRTIYPIAHIYNDFKDKFGLPKQSGLAPHLMSRIVMTPKFRVAEAFRGIEDYDRLWLLWLFDDDGKGFSPTVRPPMLGGNERMGVFATRSPNRPNHIGMTNVELISYEWDPKDGPVITVAGADIRSGTAIIDIKPYISAADCQPVLRNGFTSRAKQTPLTVAFDTIIPREIDENSITALKEVLSLDPRPRYQDDPSRIYGMDYGDYNIKFKVDGNRIIVLSF